MLAHSPRTSSADSPASSITMQASSTAALGVVAAEAGLGDLATAPPLSRALTLSTTHVAAAALRSAVSVGHFGRFAARR